MFLAPDKIPSGKKEARLINHETGDTLTVHIHQNYQPVFTNKQKDTIDFDYTIKSVVFESESGNKLNGWFLTPDSGRNQTTLLFMHGNGGNIFTQYSGLIPLVRKGFRILLFDYSGYGFSEGKATRKNILLDGISALKYINRDNYNVKDRIIIYGQSLGGHLAANVAAMYPDLCDGLVIEGAFTSHKDIAAHRAGLFGRIFVSEQYSAKEAIGMFKKPVLVIHSKDDEVIPYEMGKDLFDHANEPREFYSINKCHICGPVYYTEGISSRIKRMNPGHTSLN